MKTENIKNLNVCYKMWDNTSVGTTGSKRKELWKHHPNPSSHMYVLAKNSMTQKHPTELNETMIKQNNT